jgi:hypothetical protein
MTEYLQLGHMEPVQSNLPDNPKHVFYLPHHAVITEGPNTQKIRVVFDGYSKSVNGISLNEKPSTTRRHGNFAGVHTLLLSNSTVLINIITGVSPPHFDFVVYYVLCQC